MALKIPKNRLNDDSIKKILRIQDLLCIERTLFLSSKIDTAFANKIIPLLLYLDLEKETDISLLINSKGGDALATISLYDTIQYINSDVCTKVLGIAASGASLILAAGTKSKRVALPHARIMMHQPVTPFSCETLKELRFEVREMLELRKTMTELYSQETGKPVDVVKNDMQEMHLMSAKEAQEYGIIDTIIKEVRISKIEQTTNDHQAVDNANNASPETTNPISSDSVQSTDQRNNKDTSSNQDETD